MYQIGGCKFMTNSNRAMWGPPVGQSSSTNLLLSHRAIASAKVSRKRSPNALKPESSAASQLSASELAPDAMDPPVIISVRELRDGEHKSKTEAGMLTSSACEVVPKCSGNGDSAAPGRQPSSPIAASAATMQEHSNQPLASEADQTNTAHATSENHINSAPQQANASEDCLSKNQLKKRAKAQRRTDLKAQRKLQDKEKKAKQKEQKQQAAAARMAAMTPEEKAEKRALSLSRLEERRQHDQLKKEQLQQALENGQRIVIDLDFEGFMTDVEVNSMVYQLTFCYAANKAAAAPCHLYLTSVTGTIAAAIGRQVSGYQNWQATKTEQSYLDAFPKTQRSKLLYLTADSETELQDIAHDDVLVIGGLVDRNRHKNLCSNRAAAEGIRTARLPIGDLVRTSSQVLTVNQVVEILLHYNHKKDWKAAFLAAVPNRKRDGEDNGHSSVPADKKPCN